MKYEAKSRAKTGAKSKALKPDQKKEVKALIAKEINVKAEAKQYSSGLALTNFYNGTGLILKNMTDVSQGLLDTNRVGDELYMKALHLRYAVYNGTGTTSNAYNVTRVIVFQYKDPDNTPIELQMFISTIMNGTYSAFSSRNIDYMGVYNFLYDKIHTTSNPQITANTASDSNCVSVHRASIPLKHAKRKLQFEAGGQIQTNGLWLCVIGLFPSVAANPSFGAEWNLTFNDI